MANKVIDRVISQKRSYNGVQSVVKNWRKLGKRRTDRLKILSKEDGEYLKVMSLIGKHLIDNNLNFHHDNDPKHTANSIKAYYI